MENKISKTAREILNYYVVDRLTISEIATRRKTSRQAVYKVIKKLKEKGVLNLALIDWNKGVDKTDTTTLKPIRLHAQHFIIKPILKNQHYFKHIGKTIRLDKNTIEINQDNIEVYSNKDFYGKDAYEATRFSFNYFWTLFVKLEHRLKTLLVKEGKDNIKLVNAHYSHIKNPLAIKCLAEKTKIRVKASEDHKTWLIVDNSLNLKELETIHPKTNKKDMAKVIQPFFNDLRDNVAPLPSEGYKMILGLADGLKVVKDSLEVINKRLNDLSKD